MSHSTTALLPIIRHKGHGPHADPRPCPVCQKLFQPTTRSLAMGRGKACTVECAHVLRGQQVHEGFDTPESTKAERIRANGLVNKRLKLGFFTKPTTCGKCGKVAKLDSHHHDYSKPGEVFWLCRSCHMLAHRQPGFLDGLTPFNTAKAAQQTLLAAFVSVTKGGAV